MGELGSDVTMILNPTLLDCEVTSATGFMGNI